MVVVIVYRYSGMYVSTGVEVLYLYLLASVTVREYIYSIYSIYSINNVLTYLTYYCNVVDDNARYRYTLRGRYTGT